MRIDETDHVTPGTMRFIGQVPPEAIGCLPVARMRTRFDHDRQMTTCFGAESWKLPGRTTREIASRGGGVLYATCAQDVLAPCHASAQMSWAVR